MSRKHPNRSKNFSKKRATREKRKANLLILREAQRLYRLEYGCPYIKNIHMNRKKLLEIKEKVVENYHLTGKIEGLVSL